MLEDDPLATHCQIYFQIFQISFPSTIMNILQMGMYEKECLQGQIKFPYGTAWMY